MNFVEKHSKLLAITLCLCAAGPVISTVHAIMITDSLMVKSLPVGTRVPFGGQMITLMPDGSAHLDAGSLAGSTLNVNRGLEILVEKAGVPWLSAINSCTINPASYLGFEDRKGSIQAGKDADLVVLADNYDVIM